MDCRDSEASGNSPTDDNGTNDRGNDSSLDNEDDEGMFDMFTGDLRNDDGHDSVTRFDPVREPAIWSPLSRPDDIRVVEPKTAESDLLLCSLCNVSLHSLPPYSALSYAWGETHSDGSHLTHTIYCNNADARVSESLYTALVHIREVWERAPWYTVGASLMLWIDALCINQSDLAERMAQVQLMRQVYSQALRTIIWLGPSGALPHDWAHHTFVLSKIYTDAAESKKHEDICKAVVHFLERRSWFQGRWVLQEITLSQSRWVLLGTALFPMEKMLAIMARLGVTDVQERLTVLIETPHRQPLLHHLIHHRSTKCSNLLDVIFSLLSTSEDGDKIVPDYSKSIAEVFAEVAKLYVREEYLYIVLIAAAAFPGDPGIGNPTWVPDWTLTSCEDIDSKPILERPESGFDIREMLNRRSMHMPDTLDPANKYNVAVCQGRLLRLRTFLSASIWPDRRDHTDGETVFHHWDSLDIILGYLGVERYHAAARFSKRQNEYEPESPDNPFTTPSATARIEFSTRGEFALCYLWQEKIILILRQMPSPDKTLASDALFFRIWPDRFYCHNLDLRDNLGRRWTDEDRVGNITLQSQHDNHCDFRARNHR